jgi:hypothetical protein
MDYIIGVSLISFLDATIAFFIVRIITYLISLRKVLPAFLGVPSDVWTALLIGIITFAWTASRRAAAYDVRDVEQRVPAFSEMLTTLKDTLTETNPVIDQFRNDVLRASKSASTASLLPLRSIGIKTSVIFTLLILFTFLPLLSPLFSFIPDELNLPDEFILMKPFEGDIGPAELQDDESIYGEASINEDFAGSLDITVDLSTGAGNFSQPLAWQNTPPKAALAYTARAAAVLDNPAIEELPEEYDFAKAYNLKIRSLH